LRDLLAAHLIRARQVGRAKRLTNALEGLGAQAPVSAHAGGVAAVGSGESSGGLRGAVPAVFVADRGVDAAIVLDRVGLKSPQMQSPTHSWPSSPPHGSASGSPSPSPDVDGRSAESVSVVASPSPSSSVVVELLWSSLVTERAEHAPRISTNVTIDVERMTQPSLTDVLQARPMHVLVINCGSSSIKSEIIDTETGRRHGSFVIERIGEQDGAAARLRWGGPWADEAPRSIAGRDHASALTIVLPELLERLAAAKLQLAGVAHRVVHGGDRFAEPVRIDAEVEAT